MSKIPHTCAFSLTRKEWNFEMSGDFLRNLRESDTCQASRPGYLWLNPQAQRELEKDKMDSEGS